MLTKKLIGFDEDLLVQAKIFAEKNSLSFSEGVRQLILLGINLDHCENENDTTGDSVDLRSLVQTVKELRSDFEETTKKDAGLFLNLVDRIKKLRDDFEEVKKNYSYFQADSTQSKLIILTKVSKMFKNHINNRDIHLQD